MSRLFNTIPKKCVVPHTCDPSGEQKDCCATLIENDETQRDALDAIAAAQKACCDQLIANDATQSALLVKIDTAQKVCCDQLLANDDRQISLLENIDENLKECCEVLQQDIGDLALDQKVCCDKLLANDVAQTELLEKIDTNQRECCENLQHDIEHLATEQKACCDKLLANDVAQSALLVKIDNKQDECCEDLQKGIDQLTLNQKECCDKLLANDNAQTALLVKIDTNQQGCCANLQQGIDQLALDQKVCCDKLTANDVNQSAVLSTIVAKLATCCDQIVVIDSETDKIDAVRECTMQIKSNLEGLLGLPNLIGNCGESVSVCQLLTKIDTTTLDSLHLLSQCDLKELCKSIASIVADIDTLTSILGDPVANTTLMGTVLELKALLLNSLQKSETLQTSVDAIAQEQKACFQAIKAEDAVQTACLQTLQENDARELDLLAGISATLGSCCDQDSVCSKLKLIQGDVELIAEIKACTDKLKVDMATLQALPAQIGDCGKESLCWLANAV